jgi:glutamyl-Q tRNA(Asp) synthetase
MVTSAYRGRFAPSPTGPLHLGSLSTALASFLDARSHRGAWLLRIEDLDPPREQHGATRRILASLRAHALHWDETELYQHDRTAAYERVIAALLDSGDAFHCTCSRQDLHLGQGAHVTACPRSRTPPAGESAVRLHARDTPYRFADIFLGEVELPGPAGTDDFVIRRRDGLYAYQLAVVIDDAEQQITHVVRGRDLLESTPHQIFLRTRLGLPPVNYGHIPLLLNARGQKLSKQNHAPALDDARAPQNLLLCLEALGQLPPPAAARDDCVPILNWAIAHWQRALVPAQDRVVLAGPATA